MSASMYQAPQQTLSAINAHLKNRFFLLFIILTLAFITLVQIPVSYALLAQLSCLNAAVYLCISLNPAESEALFQPENARFIINTVVSTLVVLLCKVICIADLPGIYTLCIAFFPAIISLLNTYPQYTLLLTLLFQVTDSVIYQPCTHAFQPTTERLNAVSYFGSKPMENSHPELKKSPAELTPTPHLYSQYTRARVAALSQYKTNQQTNRDTYADPPPGLLQSISRYLAHNQTNYSTHTAVV